MKVLAAIQSSKGQSISCLISVGLDVLGICGFSVASSMSLVKDCGEMLLRLLFLYKMNKANLFAVVYDLAGFIPVYV